MPRLGLDEVIKPQAQALHLQGATKRHLERSVSLLGSDFIRKLLGHQLVW